MITLLFAFVFAVVREAHVGVFQTMHELLTLSRSLRYVVSRVSCQSALISINKNINVYLSHHTLDNVRVYCRRGVSSFDSVSTSHDHQQYL